MDGLYNVNYRLRNGNSNIRFAPMNLPMSEVPTIGDYVILEHNYSRGQQEYFKVVERSISYDKKEINITFE